MRGRSESGILLGTRLRGDGLGARDATEGQVVNGSEDYLVSPDTLFSPEARLADGQDGEVDVDPSPDRQVIRIHVAGSARPASARLREAIRERLGDGTDVLFVEGDHHTVAATTALDGRVPFYQTGVGPFVLNRLLTGRQQNGTSITK